MYNLNKQGKIFINHRKKLLSIDPNPLSSSFYGTTLGLFGLHGYVLLLNRLRFIGCDHFTRFRVLNKVSVWAVKVGEEQSIVTFLVPAFLSFKFFPC